MELAKLIGSEGELAVVATRWMEKTVQSGVCACDSTLDSMSHEDKIRLVRGMCGILIMWSYDRHGSDPYPSGKNELVISIKKEVEWQANAGRQGLYAQYLASNILTASNGEDEQEFYRQLGLLEPDENGPLLIRKRTIERVIQELSSWFRYYTWNHTWLGYGQSGQDNVRSALEGIKQNRVKIIDREKQAWDAIDVEPAVPAVAYKSLSEYFDRELAENPKKTKSGYFTIIKRAIKK